MSSYRQAIAQYNERHAPSPFSPKAVLFDMDGVLYRSMHYHARAWHETMLRYGIDMPEQEAFELEGMRGVEIILMKMKAAGRPMNHEQAHAIYEEKGERFASYGQVEIMEGVTELMKAVKQTGMDIGVVTGSGQHTLLDKLEDDFCGLIDRKFVVTSFDVERGKPAPDPYLQGLRKVNAQPCEAIVVENAPLGVRSAVAAGIFTLAVNTGPLPETMLEREGTNLVFSSMPHLRDEWERFTEAISNP